MRLFPDDGSYIVFVDPDAEPIEPVGSERGDVDTATWLVFNAMHASKRSNKAGIRAYRLMRMVRRSVMEWLEDNQGERYDRDRAETLADVYVRTALVHPDSPFGLGNRLETAGRKEPMHVVFRGECYSRNVRGVLTQLPECKCGIPATLWVSPDAWHLLNDMVNAWADQQGIN